MSADRLISLGGPTERSAKTCSRVRENFGALPHQDLVLNSDESGNNTTKTALERCMWCVCFTSNVHWLYRGRHDGFFDGVVHYSYRAVMG